ncbi:four-carbon acid sugar kinase family protein [Herbaspirillum sp. SJZ099]|uniref:four-carbon acid sugar kinase family protein n=1 Tax=Herbaspirillum sp. SJZ099 TaxID=2572916 RepID=UPI0011A80E3D|nr:four-carbon acid sugar kinase family protein [Herbaspirillum sp. SJZ099]TWC69595.1 uncharacterized protein YgbK (DUF1537 family) [Herbaspirillum sp. SJZ099]
MRGNGQSPTLRLAFYGDDFTGSTDALEVLAFSGLRCALFLKAPTPAMLERLGGFDAIGVAGDSRGMSPAEMDVALPPVFQALHALDAPIVHYKVCSTFDSSPAIGSIGRVMEIARAQIGADAIPIVAGTPALQRYCLFGNLFARSGTDGRVYRIDRHPIMRRHPVTPMDEGDLAAHLGRQTALPIGNFHLPLFELAPQAREQELDAQFADAAAVLLDTASSDHLTELGRLLEREAQLRRASRKTLFAVGSSGLEYALTQWWQSQGRLPQASRSYRHVDGAACILAVSGSASPLSAQQVDAAIDAGFEEIAVDATALVGDDTWQDAQATMARRAVAALHAGRSVIIHTARGPGDARIDAMIASLAQRGMDREQARHQGGRLLGQRLGLLTQAILKAAPLQRLILSGGDTSSQITQVLGPDALEISAKLAPGAPLCQVISDKEELRGLEISLKGGQMGNADFFVTALRGNL